MENKDAKEILKNVPAYKMSNIFSDTTINPTLIKNAFDETKVNSYSLSESRLKEISQICFGEKNQFSNPNQEDSHSISVSFADAYGDGKITQERSCKI
ncbi:MAG: hypothetical protein NTX05_05325 [Fusobacteria bacterium]|nr:hypothetical protein [Fusobacteriota bacterium]